MANFVENLSKQPFFDEKNLPLHSVHTDYGEISFAMFGETTEFRVRTLFTKEPETIRWIDTFKSGDVFWDIGANIGCYSLYAARRQDIKVFAFEPSPVNFWLLTLNSAINHFGEVMTAFPFALSATTGVVRWEPHVSAGSADNQIQGGGQQQCVASQTYRIDDLIRLDVVEFPQHIKLDVDGLERQILAGAGKILCDLRLHSVLCEVDESNPEETKSIVELMLSQGFSAPAKRHAPYYDEYHYAPMFNYLFQRDDVTVKVER